MDLVVDEILGRLADTIKHGGVSEMASLVKAERRRVECTTVNVAVTGTSRVGKSSFINAVMGFKDGDSGAAPTNATEPVAKPASYGQPGNPNAVFWELPNIEGLDFSPSDYLKAVGVDRYVAFFIMSASEFTKQAAALANELKRIGKQFYFIRSKIDLDAQHYKEAEFAEDVLHIIDTNRFENLDIESASSLLFCVSSYQREKYDFRVCIQALQKNCLPALQKHALLLSLNHLANKMELKSSLKELIPVSAIYSCVVEAVPVDKLPYPVNIQFLYDEIRFYRAVLGLEYPALNKCAKQISRPTFVLSDEIRTKLAKELTVKSVVEELVKWTEHNITVPPSIIKWLPLLQSLPGERLSGASTIRLLDAMLEQFADDADRVERKMVEVERDQ